MADDKPIIIIKKGGGHGGHHGGAWKIAYADFVTAMMAFFMVMWLVNSAEQVTKQNIASYFRKPGLFASGSGTPLLIGEAGILTDGYVPPHPEDTKQRHKGSSSQDLKSKSGTESTTELKKRVSIKGEEGKVGNKKRDSDSPEGFARIKTVESDADFELEKAAMKKAAEEVKEQLRKIPGLKDLLGQVEVKIESDGLVIDIMDTEKTSMFGSGSAQITAEARAAFSRIAAVIAKSNNPIEVIGHTDAQAFSARPGGYTNWELSADRANAARRLLEQEGIETPRFQSVVGRADRELKRPQDPTAPANRRITLKMKINEPGSTPEEAESESGSALDDLFEGTPGAATKTGDRTTPTAPSPTEAAKKEEEEEFVPDESDSHLIEPTPRPGVLRLPRERPPTMNPPVMPRDKIFVDDPVIGPRAPFAGE